MQNSAPLTLVIVTATLLSACTRGWPPEEEKRREHFAEYRTEIEALEARIPESGYVAVWAGGWQPGSDEIPDYIGVGVQTEHGRERFRVTGEEAIDWNRAFLDARVWQIGQDDRGTQVSLTVDFPEQVLGSAWYWRPAEQDEPFVDCRAEFRDVRCGMCGIALEDDWWLVYLWTPEWVEPDLLDAAMEGEISWDEYEERDHELRQVCREEGARIIGIPMTTEDSDN